MYNFVVFLNSHFKDLPIPAFLTPIYLIRKKFGIPTFLLFVMFPQIIEIYSKNLLFVQKKSLEANILLKFHNTVSFPIDFSKISTRKMFLIQIKPPFSIKTGWQTWNAHQFFFRFFPVLSSVSFSLSLFLINVI